MVTMEKGWGKVTTNSENRVAQLWTFTLLITGNFRRPACPRFTCKSWVTNFLIGTDRNIWYLLISFFMFTVWEPRWSKSFRIFVHNPPALHTVLFPFFYPGHFCMLLHNCSYLLTLYDNSRFFFVLRCKMKKIRGISTHASYWQVCTKHLCTILSQ